jgi:hypothetical protein
MLDYRLVSVNVIEIFEPVNSIRVNTPKGKARIWLVNEYGMETSKLFTCILDNGQIWEFTNSQITVEKNPTCTGDWD